MKIEEERSGADAKRDKIGMRVILLAKKLNNKIAHWLFSMITYAPRPKRVNELHASCNAFGINIWKHLLPQDSIFIISGNIRMKQWM